MRSFLDVIAYIGELVSGFFERKSKKGFKSACIFARVSLQNFWVRQGNKWSERYAWFRRTECPCCGWRGFDFWADDTTKFWLRSVFCPDCGSHERQRMLHLYIHRHDPDLPNTPGRMLHFAAEPDVRKIFAHNKRLIYFSTDYELDAVRARCLPGTGFLADIQRLGVASDAFDIVFCLHVLEHVRRDRDAIKEIRRVLKPNGVAYIMVPFDMSLSATEEWEVPDPDIHHHIWAYATSDFRHRLDVFDYAEIKPDSFLTAAEQARFKIPPKEIIYRCVKRAPSAKTAATARAAHASP